MAITKITKGEQASLPISTLFPSNPAVKMVDLRGLTKPDILRLVKVPGENKIINAILKYKADLKKQQIKQERQRELLDQEIDEQLYELYGITADDRRIIEGNL